MGHPIIPNRRTMAVLLRAAAEILPDVTRNRMATGTDVHRALVAAAEGAYPDITGVPLHRLVDACGHELITRLVDTDRVRRVSVEPTWPHLGQYTRGRGLSDVVDLMTEVAARIDPDQGDWGRAA